MLMDLNEIDKGLFGFPNFDYTIFLNKVLVRLFQKRIYHFV